MPLETNDLTNNDLTVLESLQSAPQAVSQRELARRTGLSVGLINAVIRKLVQTGYVKTSHLDQRSLEYLLTPQGFSQAAHRSYRYIADTVKRYQTIQINLRIILEKLSSEGFTQFHLHGDGELAEIVSLFFSDEKKGMLRRDLPMQNDSKSVVLNAGALPLEHKGFHVVDLVKALGNGTK